jgi:hypothetical protein
VLLLYASILLCFGPNSLSNTMILNECQDQQLCFQLCHHWSLISQYAIIKIYQHINWNAKLNLHLHAKSIKPLAGGFLIHPLPLISSHDHQDPISPHPHYYLITPCIPNNGVATIEVTSSPLHSPSQLLHESYKRLKVPTKPRQAQKAFFL